jgi:D-alanine-D-alanine ligase-like ATP-grasp enzyme/acylphosphatase
MKMKARRLLKYLYFGTLCTLLNPDGNDNNPYVGSPVKYRLTKIVPSKNKAAVKLLISGNVRGTNLNKWLRNIARIYKLEYWLKNIDKNTIEILAIGLSDRVQRFVVIVREGFKKEKIDRFNTLWFNKPQKAVTNGYLNCIDVQPCGTGSGQESYIINFGGDTCLGDYYLDKPQYITHFERLKENPLSFFEGVKPLVDNSDFLILNYSSVLADNLPNYLERKKYSNWDNPTRTIDLFKQLGVTAVSLANNYTMVYGSDILLETKRQLEQAGIKCFGAGKDIADSARPLRLELRGIKSNKTVYIFAGMHASKRYRDKHKTFANKNSPGINYLSLARIKRDIVYIRAMEPDAVIIVFPHWLGLRYRHVTAQIEDICNELIAAGANYIFGHGTHMYEWDKRANNKAIVYSIGNFVFNSPDQYSKFGSLPYSVIIQLKFEENEAGWHVSCKQYPIISDNKISGFRPKLIESDEVTKFHKFINDDLNDSYEILAKSDANGFYYLTTRKSKNTAFVENYIQSAVRRVANKLSKSVKNTYHGKPYTNADLFLKELQALGYTTKKINRYVIAYVGSERLIFFVSDTSYTSLLGAMIVNNKAVAREFLKKSGVSIAKGKHFKRNQKDQAKHFALSLTSAVVKPSDCNRGTGVSLDICSEQEFEDAWYKAIKASKSGVVLVEEQFQGGIEARYLVVGGKCIAVSEKVPPYVIGNGYDTISKLIEKKNKERTKNPHLRNKLIEINEHRLSILRKQGYELSSVPHKDAIVIIDLKVGFPIGSDSFDITDEVHPLFKEVAEKAATAVPGLDVVGVDLLAYDHTQPPQKDNYIVIEVNNRPGLGSHLYPLYGKPRNVIKEIVDNALRQSK